MAEQILKVVHDHSVRTEKRQRSRSDSRSRSVSNTSEIANLADDVEKMKEALKQLFRFELADLADDVADIKEALKQLQEEVRQGHLEGNVRPVDQALQSKATTLWQAVEEIKQIQDDKFRLYDSEINKFSMGVTELRQAMDSSTFDSASETKQGDVISTHQLSEELKRVTRQQEELSDRLELLGAVASRKQDVGPTDTSLTPAPGNPEKKNASGGGKVARLGDRDQNTYVVTNEVSMAIRATSSKIGEDKLTYEKLHGSTWNASVLMCSGLLNFTINIEIGVLLLLTMLCQMTMVLIVMQNMIKSDFLQPSQDALREWRLNIAGKVEYMEPISQRSLGSRVCDPDAHSSLELSYEQAFLVARLHEYLGTAHTVSWGPVMCALAIFSWHMCVLTELQSAFATFFAFLFFPIGTTSFKWDESGLSLLSVSKSRLLFVILTVFCRICLASSLAYSGTQWLVATKGIENLLLNNVALEIVLDMDERIFETLAPCLLKQTLDELQPLPLEKIRHAWRSHLSQFVLLGTFLLSVGFELVPEIARRNDALDVLCEGNKDFVTSFDAAGYPYWVSTPRQNATNLYQETVTLIIEEQDSPLAKAFVLPSVAGSIYSLDAITGQSAADRGLRWNVNCLNLFPPKKSDFQIRWLEQRFIEVIGDPSFRSCEDLPTAMCHDDSTLGTRIRQFCSDRCGCRSGISPFPMATHLQGCPSSCQHLPGYWDNPDPEVPPCEKPSSQSWQAYAGNLSLVTSLFRTQSKFWSAFAANFSTMGCPALVAFVDFKGWQAWDLQYNLCRGTGVSNPLRGFEAMCPITCMCIAAPLACPAGCPKVQREF